MRNVYIVLVSYITDGACATDTFLYGVFDNLDRVKRLDRATLIETSDKARYEEDCLAYIHVYHGSGTQFEHVFARDVSK